MARGRERGRAAAGADAISRGEEGTTASASVLRRGRGPDDERVVPVAETGEPRARVQMLSADVDRHGGLVAGADEMFAVTPDRESRASRCSDYISLSLCSFRGYVIIKFIVNDALRMQYCITATLCISFSLLVISSELYCFHVRLSHFRVY